MGVIVSKILKSQKLVMNVLMIGVTYKKDINDIRESPALKIAGILKKEGANLVYWDPFISEIRVENVTLHSVNLNSRIVKDANIVLITTDHSNADYKMIIEEAHIIFDTRNVLRKYFKDLPISIHSKIYTL